MPQAQQKPWERYQAPQSGPWAKYASEATEAPADPQAEIKAKYGLPKELDLSKGFFAPENSELVFTYERLRKKGKATREQMLATSPKRFSQAAEEFRALTPPPPAEDSIISGGINRAKEVASGFFDNSQAGAWGATPPGTSLIEYAQGVKEGGPVAAIPIVGPMAVARTEQFETAPKSAVGAGIVDIATLALMAKGAKAAFTGQRPKLPFSETRAKIGAKIHTPEGKLTPAATKVAEVSGGAVGAATGAATGAASSIPYGVYGGGALGYKLGKKIGPTVVNKMFPEPPALVRARETFSKTQMLTEAQEAAGKENVTFDRVARVKQSQLERGAQKALDEAESARNSHAEDLLRRQKEQDALDAQALMAERDAFKAKNSHAEDLMRRQKEQDALDKTSARSEQDIKKARDAHAEDLVRRQGQQDALDREATRAKKEADGMRDKTAEDLIDRQKEQDLLDREAVRAAREAWTNRPYAKVGKAAQQQAFTKFYEKFRTENELPKNAANEMKALKEFQRGPDDPQNLINRTKKIVRPGEMPTEADLKRAGDMTQVPLERLRVLAKFGDELAKNEIVRRVRTDVSPEQGRRPPPAMRTAPPSAPVPQSVGAAAAQPLGAESLVSYGPESGAVRPPQRGLLNPDVPGGLLNMPEGKAPPPPRTAMQSTPRSESLATYNSLPKEIRQAIDAQASELKHMPQALREGREQQLVQFGSKGTLLKERLAREAARDEGLPVIGEGVKKKPGDIKFEIVFQEKRSRELNARMDKMRTSNWPGRNKLLKQIKEISEKIQALKEQLPTSE